MNYEASSKVDVAIVAYTSKLSILKLWDIFVFIHPSVHQAWFAHHSNLYIPSRFHVHHINSFPVANLETPSFHSI